MDKIIGSGNVVRLRTLIASGHWYQDRVLDLKNIFGTATCYIVVGFKVY